MSLLPGNRPSKILSLTLSKIFLLHFHSATALLVFKAPSSAILTPQHWSYALSVTNPLVCPEYAWKVARNADTAQHSPASLGNRWPSAAPRGSLLPGNLCLVPLLATRNLCFNSKRRRFAQHHERAQARAPGGGSPTWFQPQQQAEPQQLPQKGRSKLFGRELTQKGVWNPLQDSQITIWERRHLFPKNRFILNPWKLTGNQLEKNHGKSCKVPCATCFQAELSIAQPLPASGYITVSSELKFTPTHFCTILQIRDILRN